VVADGLTNDRHDSNTELIAQGISNMVCPFLWRTAGDRSYRAEVSEHQQRRQISGFWDRSQPDSFGNRVGLCRMGGKRADLGYVGRAVQPLDMLRKAGFIDVIGRENLCAHFDAALNRAKSLVQPTG
jgi:MFS superfamily sulfate permease-like transporter